jgi:DNA recombination protein RmuC
VCLQTDPSTVKPPRVTVLLSIVSFLAGLGLAWVVLSGRRAALAERLRGAASDGARLAAELAAEKAARAELAASGSRLGAELAAEKAGAEARVAELRSAHDRLKAEFSELSASALRANRDDFLKLAEQSFSQLHDKSAGDLTSRQQAIDLMVKPLRESLEKVDAKINELEQKRERAYGDLGRQLESLSSAQLRMHAETTKLSSALSTTRTAGTWGEVQLRRVVELADMTEHCDFEVQQGFKDESGRIIRPDLVVSLPGGQRIVVDAKAPTDAYREAAAEVDPERRLAKLAEHAAKVRGHIETLASREYWAAIRPSPEYVILFLPGDSFLAAAIESDPGIMDRAINRRVLLATPMTLVALLKAAAYGWKQEAMSRGAAEVSELGRMLHDRISVFAEHMGATAKGLSAAVKHFNAAIGSFEQSLLPGARRFTELGAKGTKELVSPERIELEVRDTAKKG